MKEAEVSVPVTLDAVLSARVEFHDDPDEVVLENLSATIMGMPLELELPQKVFELFRDEIVAEARQ